MTERKTITAQDLEPEFRDAQKLLALITGSGDESYVLDDSAKTALEAFERSVQHARNHAEYDLSPEQVENLEIGSNQGELEALEHANKLADHYGYRVVDRRTSNRLFALYCDDTELLADTKPTEIKAWLLEHAGSRALSTACDCIYAIGYVFEKLIENDEVHELGGMIIRESRRAISEIDRAEGERRINLRP